MKVCCWRARKHYSFWFVDIENYKHDFWNSVLKYCNSDIKQFMTTFIFLGREHNFDLTVQYWILRDYNFNPGMLCFHLYLYMRRWTWAVRTAGYLPLRNQSECCILRRTAQKHLPYNHYHLCAKKQIYTYGQNLHFSLFITIHNQMNFSCCLKIYFFTLSPIHAHASQDAHQRLRTLYFF